MRISKTGRDVGIFTVFSFLYSWPIFFAVDAWLVPQFMHQGQMAAARLTLAFGHMLGMLGPACAALLMWRVYEKTDPPAWKWSLPKYYLWVVCAALLFWTVPGLTGLLLGDKFESPIPLHMWIMIGGYLGGGWLAGLAEETGWCAYLLPKLSPTVERARAIIISGIIRGLWHWPVLVGPALAQVAAGEKRPLELLIFAAVIAFQLAFSNIFFSAVFGWIWYRTQSMALVGWAHQWYDLARDATILLMVGYGRSLWVSPLSVIVFSGLGCWLLIQIGEREGTQLHTLFRFTEPRQPEDAGV